MRLTWCSSDSAGKTHPGLRSVVGSVQGREGGTGPKLEPEPMVGFCWWEWDPDDHIWGSSQFFRVLGIGLLIPFR